MTTQDPKYNHKPSEKHTLEEVLKSLQDLIRNELPGEKPAGSRQASDPTHGAGEPQGRHEQKPSGERALPAREDFAPTTPGTGPVNMDAVMRSLKDLISNELNVGDEPTPAAPGPASPPPGNQAPMETAAEELAPPDEEPTFEEPDEIDIFEEFTRLKGPEISREQSAAGVGDTEPSAAPETGLILEETYEPMILEELAPPEEPAHAPEQQAAGDENSVDFISLDEELTFEGSAEITPPPSAAPAMPELPGEITPELLNDPVETAPPPAPEPIKEEKPVPGVQQDLFFDEAPPLVYERQPPLHEHEPKQETSTESPPADQTPEIVVEAKADVSLTKAEEALPTIEVEESFDESAYFDAAAEQADAQRREVKEVQEIIASAIETPLEPETRPPAHPTTAADEPAPVQSPAPETERRSPRVPKETKLEIASDFTLETIPSVPSVDFDTISAAPAPEDQGSSHVTGEAAAPASEPPAETASSPAAPETPAAEEKTAPAEIKTGTTPEAEPPQAAGRQTAPPATGETPKPNPASPSKPPVTEKPPVFNLDEIPVLHEVVAPPAGSTLIPEPAAPSAPPLAAPDRARDIVVRAVAKLNVEMRKTGGTGLDTKTILRLQHLIRQELEKDGDKS